MTSYYIWDTFSIAFALLPCMTGLVLFRQLDRALRIFLLFLCWVAVTELFAVGFAFAYRNNMPVYNISGPIQLLLISLYFSQAIEGRQSGRIVAIIGFCGMAAGLLNVIFRQSLYLFPEGFVIMQAVATIGFGALSILSMIQNKHRGNPSFFPHFYVAAALILEWFVLLIQLAGYEQRLESLSENRWLVAHLLHITNGLFNLGVTVVFVAIAKRNRYAHTL